MIGVAAIGTHVPPDRLDNASRLAELETDAAFIEGKIGVTAVARKPAGTETSDLCVAAFGDLSRRTGIAAEQLDCLCVVTQNPDGAGLPHTSAIVHGKLAASTKCAVFDISLGCSGFVHALSLMSAFMTANGMRRGVLLTADPYSKIIAPDDRNTVLLFGDAASATLLEADPRLPRPGHFRFATDSRWRDALKSENGRLLMNGRDVFNYCAQAVPPLIQACLDAGKVMASDIDAFLLHQGSRFIVDTITRRLCVPAERVPIEIGRAGNTVSSSIPLMLADRLQDKTWKRMLLCGFGVGLSAAACLLERPADPEETR